MRNPNRIPIILDLIKKEWERNPDLRLGQLLSNVARLDGWHINDLFHYEDFRLQTALEKLKQNDN